MTKTSGEPFSFQIKFSRLIAVPGIVGVVAALIHGVRSRSLDDFVIYPLLFFIPATVAVAALAVVEWKRMGRGLPTTEGVLLTGLLLIAAYLFAAINYAVGASVKDFYIWLLVASHPKYEAIGLAAGFTAFLGTVLFAIRLRLRSVYGVTEVMAGLVIAAYRFSVEGTQGLSNINFLIAMLTAGVYLVVRGLDNIHQGLVKDPKDPWATWLCTRLGNLIPVRATIIISGEREP